MSLTKAGRALGLVAAADVQVGDEQQTARTWQVLADTWHSLHRILAEDSDE